MSKANKNPYRQGTAYHGIFEAIRASKGIVTRQSLIDAGFKSHDITVVLSPRADGAVRKGADCRGNMSARGDLYFMDKLNRKKGEDQKLRLRWRKTPLDRRKRAPKVEKASQKSQTKKSAKKDAAVA